jgi:hypothetical protein
MPEFVKDIRKTCGDVHELTTVKGPCQRMLNAKAAAFGCCWESVMQAYDVLDPQAAHKWRLWQGTVSGKGGVTFDSADCGESMGEKSYADLKGEVHNLKSVVSEQQSEIGDIMDAIWGYGGYGGNSDYGNYDPYTGRCAHGDARGPAARGLPRLRQRRKFPGACTRCRACANRLYFCWESRTVPSTPHTRKLLIPGAFSDTEAARVTQYRSFRV